jgi:hypothetical protein
MNTVICFVNDIYETFTEAFRVFSEGFSIIISMIENSPLGQIYFNYSAEMKLSVPVAPRGYLRP